MAEHNPDEKPRALSRNETHDLSMIIKDRAKVLKAHAEEQAARKIAEFEEQISTVYKWDQDEIWRQATAKAHEVVAEANKKIQERCAELGIPPQYAPGISATWHGRGENMLSQRRTELRVAAKMHIEALKKNAMTRIEHQSLDLRTQVVSMGLLSAEAKMFLESLAPVTEAMKALSFKELEAKLDQDKERSQKRLPPRSYFDPSAID